MSFSGQKQQSKQGSKPTQVIVDLTSDNESSHERDESRLPNFEPIGANYTADVVDMTFSDSESDCYEMNVGEPRLSQLEDADTAPSASASRSKSNHTEAANDSLKRAATKETKRLRKRKRRKKRNAGSKKRNPETLGKMSRKMRVTEESPSRAAASEISLSTNECSQEDHQRNNGNMTWKSKRGGNRASQASPNVKLGRQNAGNAREGFSEKSSPTNSGNTRTTGDRRKQRKNFAKKKFYAARDSKRAEVRIAALPKYFDDKVLSSIFSSNDGFISARVFSRGSRPAVGFLEFDAISTAMSAIASAKSRRIWWAKTMRVTNKRSDMDIGVGRGRNNGRGKGNHDSPRHTATKHRGNMEVPEGCQSNNNSESRLGECASVYAREIADSSSAHEAKKSLDASAATSSDEAMIRSLEVSIQGNTMTSVKKGHNVSKQKQKCSTASEKGESERDSYSITKLDDEEKVKTKRLSQEENQNKSDTRQLVESKNERKGNRLANSIQEKLVTTFASDSAENGEGTNEPTNEDTTTEMRGTLKVNKNHAERNSVSTSAEKREVKEAFGAKLDCVESSPHASTLSLSDKTVAMAEKNCSVEGTHNVKRHQLKMANDAAALRVCEGVNASIDHAEADSQDFLPKDVRIISSQEDSTRHRLPDTGKQNPHVSTSRMPQDCKGQESEVASAEHGATMEASAVLGNSGALRDGNKASFKIAGGTSMTKVSSGITRGETKNMKEREDKCERKGRSEREKQDFLQRRGTDSSEKPNTNSKFTASPLPAKARTAAEKEPVIVVADFSDDDVSHAKTQATPVRASCSDPKRSEKSEWTTAAQRHPRNSEAPRFRPSNPSTTKCKAPRVNYVFSNNSFDTNKNYNYNYTQFDAMREQERLFREARERVQAQTKTWGEPSFFSKPVNDVTKLNPDHYKWRDPYARLGLPRNSPIVLVKKQYRRLALLYHPDKSKLVDAQTRFQAITEAYHKVSRT